MKRIVVATPVRERAWILPTWFKALEAQKSHDLDIKVVAYYDHSEDETLDILKAHGAAVLQKETLKSPRKPKDLLEHTWGSVVMYRHMASIRNVLASFVEERNSQFDYMFSLDSDIILKPGDLEKLLDGIGPDDVVGPLVNMDRRPYHLAWNYMFWLKDHPEWAERRVKPLEMKTGKQPVDVVLAAFLIPCRNRSIPRWIETAQGEDVGWPMKAKEAGLKLFVDTNIVCRHVMNKRVMEVSGPEQE